MIASLLAPHSVFKTSPSPAYNMFKPITFVMLSPRSKLH